MTNDANTTCDQTSLQVIDAELIKSLCHPRLGRYHEKGHDTDNAVIAGPKK